MGWFKRLRNSPAPVIEHPIFGSLRATCRPEEGPWSWETLRPINTQQGSAFVNLDAGKDGPTQAQEEQWQKILAQLGPLTGSAAPLIASELKSWPVAFDPADPWRELTWEGADLHADTNENYDFAIAYGCKSWPDAMITIYFKDDRPVLSRLDD